MPLLSAVERLGRVPAETIGPPPEPDVARRSARRAALEDVGLSDAFGLDAWNSSVWPELKFEFPRLRGPRSTRTSQTSVPGSSTTRRSGASARRSKPADATSGSAESATALTPVQVRPPHEPQATVSLRQPGLAEAVEVMRKIALAAEGIGMVGDLKGVVWRKVYLSSADLASSSRPASANATACQRCVLAYQGKRRTAKFTVSSACSWSPLI